MNKLTVYKCLECGHYTISKYDGNRCAKCKGTIAPIGDGTYIDKNKEISVNVNLKETDIFKNAISLLKEICEREDVPQNVKNIIINYDFGKKHNKSKLPPQKPKLNGPRK